MNPFFRQVLFYLFIIALVIAILSIFSDGQQPEKITYDEFIQQIEADQVKKVVMDGNDITATLKNGRIVSTYRPEDHNLTGLLLEKDIEFEPNPPPGPKWWQSAITYLFPILLLLGIFFFLCSKPRAAATGL